jgi:NADH-quinone oxidoreductase subunit N
MYQIFILSGLGILTLLAEIFNFKKVLLPVVVIGLLTAVALLFKYFHADLYLMDNVETMFAFDSYANSFIGLISVVVLLWVLCNTSFFHDETNNADHMGLILFSVVGAYCLASFTNFVMLFLGIEILSIPMYVLAGSNKRSLLSNESALKYFLMGSFATGVLLFGITLIYGSTGTFDMQMLRIKMSTTGFTLTPMFTIGLVMLVCAMAFKTSLAPFHFWAPDVYTGSPTPVTAFMATIVKAGAFAAFMRIASLPYITDAYRNVFYVLIVASLAVGNITAVFQQNAKRLLAYSSISHAGFMLIALTCFNGLASMRTLFFYIAAYSVTSLAAFFVLKIVSDNQQGEDAISSFNGLAKRSPLLAGTMTIAMLSMAGIPPLSGFFAKYYVLLLAMQQNHLWLVIVAIIASLIGVYYYFRIIIAMFTGDGSSEKIQLTVLQQMMLVILSLLIMGIGLNSWVYTLI